MIISANETSVICNELELGLTVVIKKDEIGIYQDDCSVYVNCMNPVEELQYAKTLSQDPKWIDLQTIFYDIEDSVNPTEALNARVYAKLVEFAHLLTAVDMQEIEKLWNLI